MAETIGKIIKYLRQERNWTREELAERLGVTSQVTSKREFEGDCRIFHNSCFLLSL